MFRAVALVCFVTMQISSANGSSDSDSIPGTVDVDTALDDHAGAAAALAAALASAAAVASDEDINQLQCAPRSWSRTRRRT